MPAIRVFAAAIPTLMLVTGSAAVAQGWARENAGWAPVPRSLYCIAYDSLGQRTIVHGGSGASGALRDTWQWNGMAWTAISTASAPGGRQAAAMVYDSGRGRMVLFGGYVGMLTVLADTWEFDGSAWLQRTPAVAPPARAYHALAFDSVRGRTVLFGGMDLASRRNDTWEWDGNAWVACSPASSPPARAHTAMAFDSARARTVLFGGADGTSTLGDTWEWDGNGWQQAQPAVSPPARQQHVMAFDRARARTMFFGGPTANDTWEWDGILWRQWMVQVAPAPAGSFGMVYDEARDRTVLLDGSQVYFGTGTETWEWNAHATGLWALARAYGHGCGTTVLSIAAANDSRPILGQTMSTRVDQVPTGAAFMALGGSAAVVGGTPLPMDLANYGMPGCWLWQDCSAHFAEPCVGGGSAAQYALPIPNTMILLGLEVNLQAWAPWPNANPAGMVTSNGLWLVLGDH